MFKFTEIKIMYNTHIICEYKWFNTTLVVFDKINGIHNI